MASQAAGAGRARSRSAADRMRCGHRQTLAQVVDEAVEMGSATRYGRQSPLRVTDSAGWRSIGKLIATWRPPWNRARPSVR
jgi:hypothetical protein